MAECPGSPGAQQQLLTAAPASRGRLPGEFSEGQTRIPPPYCLAIRCHHKLAIARAIASL
eukprot:1787297-Alexandrium_andersonii.AAC.1